MADLDSFFAKKDKKKLKGKKFTCTDDIAKRLEESEKKSVKQFDSVLKKIETVTRDPDNANIEIKEEEEWKDFVDDTDKDLTDLKITKLNIEDDEERGLGGISYDDDRDKNNGDEKKDGVWKTADVVPVQETPPVKVIELPVEEPKAPGGSSYVPPHLRNVSSAPSTAKGSRKSKEAPDITNTAAFPSLADTKPSVVHKNKIPIEDTIGFEDVKHGTVRRPDTYAPPKLSVTNRFDALSESS